MAGPDKLEVKLRIAEAVIKANPREAVHNTQYVIDAVAKIATSVLQDDKAETPKPPQQTKKQTAPAKAKTDKDPAFLD